MHSDEQKRRVIWCQLHDMLRELEVAEGEEEVDRDEEGEDDTHLPDQLAECFHITYTTWRGRETKVPVKYT